MKPFASTNADRLSRRDFLKVAGGLGISSVGMALLNACGARLATPSTDELETTKITLVKSLPSVCLAPQYLAEELLRQEGFTEIQYVETVGGAAEKPLIAGEADISLVFVASSTTKVDAGEPITILAGVHVGCFELFGVDKITTINDLKGKTIPVSAMGASQHYFLATMLAYVGLDPNKDVNWVVHPPAEAIQLLTENKVDAFLAFPPTAQGLRAKKIAHVVVNSMMDDPWSQYFCCMVAANREFMQQHPVATKRALRALLKATDLCALEPEKAARFMVDNGYTPNYDYALEAMKNIPYNRWREYEPEDTVRFYALRLREAGIINSSPDEIITKGTDWTFLNDLKTESKK